jgi:ribonuclease R
MAGKHGKKGREQASWQRLDPQYQREADKYERPVPSRELLLQQLTKRQGPMELEGLAESFSLETEQDVEALRRRLQAMVRDGQLVRNRKGAYGPIDRMDLVRGIVQGHRDGFGFLTPDDVGSDVFLPPRQMRSLLHGDRALVRVVGYDRRNRREGSLVRVLERNTAEVVGRFIRESGVGMVVPDNSRISQDILIPDESRGNAQEGEIVTAELVEQPDKRHAPVGRIKEILGEHMAPGMEIDVAIRSHGLPFRWPEAVEAEIAGLGEEVGQKDKRGREDLRDLAFVTIDVEDARDFDDALYCESTRRGWKLWVAIADVSHYVHPGTALDREASLRGNSVYFPERVIPMLPEVLSNGLCSLNPDVDRLCTVCQMNVNRAGKVTRTRFLEGVMRSSARLTYTRVARVLEDEAGGRDEPDWLVKRIDALKGVFHALLAERRERGAIDFETRETQIVFGEDRKIQDIVPVERTDAHRLVEECMVAANVRAAHYLTRHKIPTLYRIHPRPEAEKLEEVRAFLAERGLGLGGGDKPEPRHYARLLAEIQGRDDAELVQTVLLRSMSQASYSPENEGHFGLALECYGHFTSPIRRYPDLLVHRGVCHLLRGGKPADFDYDFAAMETLGANCSVTERRAEEATRDVEGWLKCEYMLNKVGEEFAGIITGVTPFGLFVELDGIHIDGLVHVSSLSNDYYHHEPEFHRLRGERTGRVYHLADRMRVRVARVDLDERKIDFDPVEGKSKRRRKK